MAMAFRRDLQAVVYFETDFCFACFWLVSRSHVTRAARALQELFSLFLAGLSAQTCQHTQCTQ